MATASLDPGYAASRPVEFGLSSPSRSPERFSALPKSTVTLGRNGQESRLERAGRAKFSNLLGHSQIHVWCVIEDTTAVDAADNFLFGLAGDEGLAAEAHVASAADAVLDADDDSATALFEESLIAAEQGAIDGGSQFITSGFELAEFVLEGLLALSQFGKPFVDVGFDFGGVAGGGGGVFLEVFSLLHEIELLIFELADALSTGLDFVGQSPVFLVFLSLELLEGVFLNQLFFALGFKFESFAFGLEVFELGSNFLEPGRGKICFGLELLTFWRDMSQFLFDFENLQVAILQNQQFLNDF